MTACIYPAIQSIHLPSIYPFVIPLVIYPRCLFISDDLVFVDIIIVIVIGGVFDADHQRVPITSNGPAAIRPLLSHLLLEKQDLNGFCRQSGSFHFQSSLLLNC